MSGVTGKRAFHKILIANRGEIALRIMRTARKLGYGVVAVYSDADRDALHVREADQAVRIGEAPPAQSYLNAEAIIAAAKASGADAVHPGYGFLSESPKLAERVGLHGLTFVGPQTETIKLAGDKLRARAEAALAGLPVLPGEQCRSPEQARDVADRIGFPVLIKAAGGGGGRGIKLARDATELISLLSLAGSEAAAAFGDERLYVERFVANARHVEVQIAADAHGSVVHLGERDCSVQRRYQKVIEEATAPGLTADTREAVRAAAVAFAQAIGYRNLGTVEFVLDADSGQFSFLEINCRIQVEHPVTEAVTGCDLVAMQLQIADGEPLAFSQDEVRFDGHAVECRLNAEDVAHGYVPTPGTLSLFSVPELKGLRVDTHCEAGTVVPPYYDSLLGKLIGHAPNRDAAIDLLLEALEEVDVDGVETNRMLLISVLGHPDFRAGAVSTDWLERAMA
jgi:acetyl-CoA carboxylase biotin carboxylase subunit